MKIRSLPLLTFASLAIPGCSDPPSSPPSSPPVAEAPAPTLTDPAAKKPAVSAYKPPEEEVKIVSAKLVPWTLPGNGQQARMVMITWKNTSTQPVHRLNVDVAGYDSAGTKHDMSATNYTIYWRKTPVKPGAKYITPEGEGYVFPDSLGVVERVDVRVSSVEHVPPID